jgi:hypothetical protein
VVGTDQLSESGYFRAKIAQEKLIKARPSLVDRACHQFFEFLKGLADTSSDGDKVRLPPCSSSRWPPTMSRAPWAGSR